MQKIDFHSHILPGMDDGAVNTEMSLQMLRRLADDGVDTVILTPHFYRRDEDIKSFINRREKAYNKLLAAASQLPECPRLLLGAEVYYYPSLSADPDFGLLTTEGTDYILLELPFEHFYDNFFIDYSKFINNCGQKIIFAHIERYLSFGNTTEEFDRLLDFGKAVCQMNCSSVAEAGIFERRKILELIEKGYVSVLGSDAHNISTRAPLYAKAEKIIEAKCGREELIRLCENGGRILDNFPIGKIE